MSLVKANSESIRQAAEIIKRGGLVAFPTETVYGLGADGLNPIKSLRSKNALHLTRLFFTSLKKAGLKILPQYKMKKLTC